MGNNRNIIIGGAWPYANSSLHLGHFIDCSVLFKQIHLNFLIQPNLRNSS